MSKIQKFVDEINQVWEKYNGLSVMIIIISEDGKHIEVDSNLCPVCAKEVLDDMVTRNNLEHNHPNFDESKVH